MKTVIILLLGLSVSLAFTVGSSSEQKWNSLLSGDVQANDDIILEMYRDWLDHYNKDLSNPMQSMTRFSIFKSKAYEVIEHNSDKTQTWTKGINAWSDLTDAEFDTQYPVMDGQECSATNTKSFDKLAGEVLPESKDWRDAGVVSKVKDQGGCGSCWAFSTSGTYESHYAILTGLKGDDQVLFSEQQLVDCAGDFDNDGCRGGLPSHAFTYMYYYGLEAGEDYTYHAKDQKCAYSEPLAKGADLGAFNITEGDEASMKQVIATVGPVAVSYQVVGDFRDYKTGVYTSKTCKNGPMDVNHAVQAVGYGVENGLDYWLVKNSWGSRFGDHGYFKIEAGVNMCGIGVCNSFPVGVHTYSH